MLGSCPHHSGSQGLRGAATPLQNSPGHTSPGAPLPALPGGSQMPLPLGPGPTPCLALPRGLAGPPAHPTLKQRLGLAPGVRAWGRRDGSRPGHSTWAAQLCTRLRSAALCRPWASERGSGTRHPGGVPVAPGGHTGFEPEPGGGSAVGRGHSGHQLQQGQAPGVEKPPPLRPSWTQPPEAKSRLPVHVTELCPPRSCCTGHPGYPVCAPGPLPAQDRQPPARRAWGRAFSLFSTLLHPSCCSSLLPPSLTHQFQASEGPVQGHLLLQPPGPPPAGALPPPTLLPVSAERLRTRHRPCGSSRGHRQGRALRACRDQAPSAELGQTHTLRATQV